MCVLYFITNIIVGLFQTQDAITQETDRNFDLALYITVGSLGVTGISTYIAITKISVDY